MLTVERCENAAELLDRGGTLLLRQEPLHARMIGIAGRLVDEPMADADLLVVLDGSDVAAVAVRTPPWPVQVSAGRPAAMEALAAYLSDAHPPLAGVIGPDASAEAFAAAWSRREAVETQSGMAMRCFACSEVRMPETAGAARLATEDDRALLVPWMNDFIQEALPNEPPSDMNEVLSRQLRLPPDRGGCWVWEAGGRPVAMAVTSSPTPSGIRVFQVYTPPPLRRRGYASGLVAAVTQQELDRGRRMVFLTTDLANPTSNHIYTAIGYEPVGDERVFHFRPPG